MSLATPKGRASTKRRAVKSRRRKTMAGADRFLVELVSTTDGRQLPHDIHLPGDEPLSAKPQRLQEMEFKPLDTPNRFRLIEVSAAHDWRPKSPLAIPAAWKSRTCRSDGRHLINEAMHDDAELYDRESGLEMVAGYNRAEMEEREGQSVNWMVLIELGQPLPFPDLFFELHKSCDIGSERRTAIYPMRLVRPTAEEMERHPVALLTAEGGVA